MCYEKWVRHQHRFIYGHLSTIRISADQGYKKAQYKIGLFYESGFGTEKEFVASI